MSLLVVAASSRLDLPLCTWPGVCCLSSRPLLQCLFADKGKPVVRRGRKAIGPPKAEVAGLPLPSDASPLLAVGEWGLRCEDRTR